VHSAVFSCRHELATSYLCNYASEQAREGTHSALMKLLQNAIRYYRHWLGFGLSTMSREYPVLFDVITCRTSEGMVFKPSHPQPVVRYYLHQDHLCVARLTEHRTSPDYKGGQASKHAIAAVGLRMSDG
jgi:hypothetical protein